MLSDSSRVVMGFVVEIRSLEGQMGRWGAGKVINRLNRGWEMGQPIPYHIDVGWYSSSSI